jgi:hypothetical protein
LPHIDHISPPRREEREHAFEITISFFFFLFFFFFNFFDFNLKQRSLRPITPPLRPNPRRVERFVERSFFRRLFPSPKIC